MKAVNAWGSEAYGAVGRMGQWGAWWRGAHGGSGRMGQWAHGGGGRIGKGGRIASLASDSADMLSAHEHWLRWGVMCY
ncbi:unnamed protein product [Closterium sp. NIES-64]|nr:unnamed protein product [Closterium sp. NIES-64]